MATSVISGRVDDMVRKKADIALRNAGLTPTSLIQNVWNYIAETGEIPEAAMSQPSGSDRGAALSRLERFLESLPPANPRYANWSDDDILALKAQEHA